MNHDLLFKILGGLTAFGSFVALMIRTWYIEDEMLSAVNATLPPDQKYKLYGIRKQHWKVQKEYGRLFPDSNLIRRLWFLHILQIAAFACAVWIAS